jgi:DNA-directed RNA polymerase subunit RPC12/RpoP
VIFLKHNSKMNVNSSKNFIDVINNIKEEPFNEFVCILPPFDPNRRLLGDFQVKSEFDEEEIDLKCYVCHKTFGYLKSLNDHKKTHDRQQCKVCNKQVLTKSFEKHMETHESEDKERKFKCSNVQMLKFLSNKNLKAHLEQHNKRIECDLCSIMFSNKDYIVRHLGFHIHSGQYRCTMCKKMFDQKEVLRFHSRTVHGDPNNLQRVTKEDL